MNAFPLLEKAEASPLTSFSKVSDVFWTFEFTRDQLLIITVNCSDLQNFIPTTSSADFSSAIIILTNYPVGNAQQQTRSPGVRQMTFSTQLLEFTFKEF